MYLTSPRIVNCVQHNRLWGVGETLDEIRWTDVGGPAHKIAHLKESFRTSPLFVLQDSLMLHGDMVHDCEHARNDQRGFHISPCSVWVHISSEPKGNT